MKKTPYLYSGLLLFAAVGTIFAADVTSQRQARFFLPPAVTDTDYFDGGAPDAAKVQLGQFLFFDKILSGNKNISCATCHHPLAATGDGLSLPIGEGGLGLGVTRGTGDGPAAVPERVPRNSPPLFNLGAREFTVMFHDGRVAADRTHPSGFRTPDGDDFPPGLDNALAAQAMFPVTSGTEMAGQPGENPIADAAFADRQTGPDGVWELLAQRLRDIPEYVDLFIAASVDVTSAADISFVHAANAIGAFEASAYRADNSPFDRYLRGEIFALSPPEKRGMSLFYSAAACASCHSGKFQTDLSFHAIAMPQIGQGRGNGEGGHEDFGREGETGLAADRCRFRTPSLRNVAVTGPWGHCGAFDSLRAIVLHHRDPIGSLRAYDRSQAVLPSRPDLDALDFLALDNPASRLALEAANTLDPVSGLSDSQIDDLIAFLGALTDPGSLDLRHTVPKRVPSGLPLAE